MLEKTVKDHYFVMSASHDAVTLLELYKKTKRVKKRIRRNEQLILDAKDTTDIHSESEKDNILLEDLMDEQHVRWREAQAEVNEDIIKSAEKYLRKGQMASHKFQRVKHNPVDELKFLMPVYKDVPMFVPQVIFALMQGIKVSVVGGDEVKLVVDALRDYLPTPKENLVFAHEGGYEDLRLSNSIQRGQKAHNLKKDDFFWFVTLDCPFLFENLRAVYDKDQDDKAMVIDFNSKQNIFGGKEKLFDRNYYHKIRYNGRVHDIKEPNIFGFSADFDLVTAADEVYGSRQAGSFGVMEIFKMVWKNFKKEPMKALREFGLDGTLDISSALIQFGLNKLGVDITPIYKATSANKLGYYIDMKEVEFKATHDDPNSMKDVDGWHDLWYYRKIIDLNGGTLKGIVPYADLIEGFNEVMQGIKHKIGVLKNFKEYANIRANIFGIPEPFNKKGKLVAESAPGENPEAGLKYQKERAKAYEKTIHLYPAYSRVS